MDEAGDPEGDGGEAEVLAGADAAPGAERRQAEVAAADVDVGAALRRMNRSGANASGRPTPRRRG